MNSPDKNPDRVKIVVYAKSLTQPPIMASLVEQLSAQSDRFQTDVVSVCADIVKAVEETTLTVLIVSLHEKEELVEILNALTQVEARTQSGLLRAIVLNGLNHPRVAILLRSKGVNDIIEPNATIKSLNHKIKNSLLLVTQTLQRLQNQNIDASTVIGVESSSAPNVRKLGENLNEATWLKPIAHASDFWWIPSPRNLRFVMGRWLADMLGPGPAAGTWSETPHERQGEKGWEWQARVADDPTFQPLPGRWIFFGKQPEFVWQKNLWAFVSKFPYLAFYAEGESEPEYVRIESPALGKVKIFENSEISQLYLAKIQDSLEASLRLSKAEVSNEIPRSAENHTSPEKQTAAEWNHHESSIGVNFKAKDLRIEVGKAKPKGRNSLTPDVAIGGSLGMVGIAQAGITSGANSFDKLIVRVTLGLRNGQPVIEKEPIHVIEMTKDRASFEYPRNWIIVKDKFMLRVEFRLGNVERNFEVEWSSKTTEFIDGGGCLAHGEFTGGALAELASMVALIDQRQIELRDFFIIARGA